MAGKHKFRRAYKGLDVQKADEIKPIPGILGFLINGTQVVEVPNRNGYVYVRLRDNLSEVTQAYNDNVSPVYGLPVLLVRDENNPSRYRILSRDLGRYQDWGSSSPYLAAHGATHSFNPISIGADIVWVYNNQIMPLLVYPSGTIGAGSVLISPSTYYRNNIWHYAGGTGTASLLPYKPTGASNAKMVLIYLDDYDNPNFVQGSEFPAYMTGTNQIFSYIPGLPNTSALPLSAVRLVTGTQRILWDNLYDIRPFIIADGFIPTGTARHIIQVSGTSLPDRAILNFLGNNIWGLDNPGSGRTDIIISGSAGGGSGSLPDKEVGYGNGTSIVSSNKFAFDSSNSTLGIGGANYFGAHGDVPTLVLAAEGASRPVINLDYYGSSGYPRIQFSSASGTILQAGSVASGRNLLEISAYGFITGSSGARWREAFEFFVFTDNPWTYTGAASARAEVWIKSITGSSASSDTQIMTMTREKIDLDTSLNISGTFMTDGFRMGRGAINGYVLTSDAQGNGTWKVSGTGTSGSLPDKQIGFGNGSSIISNERFLYDAANDALTIGSPIAETIARLNILGGSDTGNSPVFDIYGYGETYYPLFETLFARGSRTGKQPTLSGDQLASLDFYGYGTGTAGANFTRGASLEIWANGDFVRDLGGTPSPSYFLFTVGSTGTSGTTPIAKLERKEINFGFDLNVSGTVRPGILQLRYYTFSGSNPPTDAQLDVGVGTPSSVGKGFTAYWNNNNAGTNVYLISSDGTNWWYQALTKAI